MNLLGQLAQNPTCHDILHDNGDTTGLRGVAWLCFSTKVKSQKRYSPVSTQAESQKLTHGSLQGPLGFPLARKFPSTGFRTLLAMQKYMR